MKIEMSQQDFGTLCICAIRYCQGRRTYMPTLVRDIVRPHLVELSDEDISVMVDDCGFQRRMNLYGDAKIDMPGWLLWEQNLTEEYKKRELKALIQDAGYAINKADPRLDVTHPLTMADLKDMVGEPVWNSNSLKWMIVQAFVDSDHPAIWLVKPDSQLYAMTAEDLTKYPLYRMKLQ